MTSSGRAGKSDTGIMLPDRPKDFRGFPYWRTGLIFFLFFLEAGCSWGPSFLHPPSVSDELASGISLYQRSDYQKSKEILLRLIRTRIGSPEIEEAQWVLVLISEKTEQPEKFRQKLRLFLKSYPGSSHRKSAEEKLAALAVQPAARGEEAPAVSLPPATAVQASLSEELRSAIRYFEQSDFARAKSLLYRIIQNKNGPSEVEEAYWYLALIAEKKDPPATAIEVFKRFIGNYPSSVHLAEAQERLLRLVDAGTPSVGVSLTDSGSKTVTEIRRLPARHGPDRISGSLITEYLFDEQVVPNPIANTQNRLSEFLDYRWRKGSGADLRFVFSGMNATDFLVSENGRTRLNKLYLEGNDIGWLSNFRVGRQPGSGSTLFNRFDGLSLSFPLSSVNWTINAGIPVDLFSADTLEIQYDRKFYETYLSVVDFRNVTGKIYYEQEYFQNFSTRRAAGLNGFWVFRGLNLSTLVDRDIDFGKFNDIMANFDYTRSIYHYSGLIEYRRNPYLDLSNALADPTVVILNPPVTTLDVLAQILTHDQMMQLALNNSQTTLDYNFGVSAEISAHWRVDLRYDRTLYNPEGPGSHGLDLADIGYQKYSDRYSVFLMTRNLYSQNDILSALFLFSPGTDSTNVSMVANLLRIWPSGVQCGARFRYENTDFSLSSSRLIRYVPGFLFRYPLKYGMEASFEADYIMEDNSLNPEWTDTIETRTSISIPF
jgi:hypothetical protein